MLFACCFACSQEQERKEHKKDSNHTAEAHPGHHVAASPASTATTKDLNQTQTAPAQTDEISQKDIVRLSEAFGHFIGRNLKTPGLNFDLDSLIAGIRDGYSGKPAPMSDKEYEEMMAKLQEQAFKKLSEHNLKAANEFLEKNAHEQKIVQIEPGKLQYFIVQEGNGSSVQEHFSPQIKYTGKFLDGTTFGSSEEVGGTITIPLDQTIPGFSKGIIGMKEGEKRKLYVHPDLGYGTTGHLPPNSLLIFDIELVKANSPETSQNLDGDDDLSDLSSDSHDDIDDRDDDDDDDDDDKDDSDHDHDKDDAHKKPQPHKDVK